MKDLVFLFDVDNTLLDNDRLQSDLFRHIAREFGSEARKRYSGYLRRAAQRAGICRLPRRVAAGIGRRSCRDPRFLHVANWLIEYPFCCAPISDVLEVLKHAKRLGKWQYCPTATPFFQPRKVERSGLWKAVGGNVLIFIHKEQEPGGPWSSSIPRGAT